MRSALVLDDHWPSRSHQLLTDLSVALDYRRQKATWKPVNYTTEITSHCNQIMVLNLTLRHLKEEFTVKHVNDVYVEIFVMCFESTNWHFEMTVKKTGQTP